VEQLEQEDYGDIGLAGRMIRVFFAPSETFEAVRQRSGWLDWFAPVVLVVVVSLVAAQIAMPVIQRTSEEVLQEQFKNMPEAQRQEMIGKMQGISQISTLVVIPVGAFALLFIIAGVLLLVSRYGLGGQVAYGQMLAVWGYSSLVGIAAAVVRTPLMLAKDTAMVHTGLGIFASEEMLKTFPGRLLAGVDLFLFWQICIAAIGLAVLSGSSTRKALVCLVILWGLWLVIQAGLGGLGSLFRGG